MLATTYLGLMGFLLFFEVVRPKEGKFDFLTLGHVMFTMSYLLPVFLLEANWANARLELMDGRPYTSNAQILVAIFVSYGFLVFGFYSKTATRLGKRVWIKAPHRSTLAVYAVGLLLVSSGAIYLYGQQYGGIINAIANITLIRSNVDVGAGSLVFVKHFMYCSLFASYLLAAFAFPSAKQPQSQTLTRLFLALFLLSVGIALIAAFLSGGRAIIIYYLVGFYLIYVLRGGATISWAAIPIVFFGALFILYGKEFFWSLSAVPDGLDAVVDRFVQAKQDPTKTEFNFYALIANFAFPLHSLNTAFTQSNSYELRFFMDWIYGIQSFIPERIFGVEKPLTVSVLNTRLILGYGESLQLPLLEFEIPVGFLAFGVYSLSWLGLLIVAYLYGWLGRCLQTALLNNLDRIFWMPCIYVLTLQVWVDFQPAGDPRVFLVANFWYFISMLLLFAIGTRISTASGSTTQLSSRSVF